MTPSHILVVSMASAQHLGKPSVLERPADAVQNHKVMQIGTRGL